MTFSCEYIKGGLCITAAGNTSPCCATRGWSSTIDKTSDIKSLVVNDTLLKMIDDESNGIVPKQCLGCIAIEERGGVSRRQKLKAFKQYKTGKMNSGDIVNGKIIHMDISFGNTCNQKCIMCSSQFSSKWLQSDIKFNKHPLFRPINSGKASQLRNWTLSYEQIDQIIDLVTSDTAVIELKGGEPFIDKRLSYFLEAATKKNPNIKFSITTNGTLIDESILSILNNIKTVVNVSISLDGINDLYTKIRGYEFNKFVPGFEILLDRLDKRHRIHINPTLMKYNVDAIAEIYEWVGSKCKQYNRNVVLNFAQTVKGKGGINIEDATIEQITSGIDQLNYIKNDPLKYSIDPFFQNTRIDIMITLLESLKVVNASLSMDDVKYRTACEEILLYARDHGSD